MLSDISLSDIIKGEAARLVSISVLFAYFVPAVPIAKASSADGPWGLKNDHVKFLISKGTGVPYGTELEKAVVPNEDWIINGVREVLS